MQHGQETLALPHRLPSVELVHQAIPRFFILKQCFQFTKRQAPQPGRQGGPDALRRARVGHGAHQSPKVHGLQSGENAVTLGQVHAAHAPFGQGQAHTSRLRSVAHQYCHLTWCGRPGVQQLDHLRGKQLRHLSNEYVFSWPLGVCLVPYRHRSLGYPGHR